MPTASTVLTADVPPAGIVTIHVPGLRPGDVEPGTKTLEVGGYPTQVPDSAYSVDFTLQNINVTNATGNVWPTTAEVVLTWEGIILEQVVSDHEVRIGTLEANQGVTDGTNATPGAIGEYLSVDNVVGLVPVANTPVQVCLIELPPGCWEIWGACDFTIAGTGVEQAGAPVAPNQLASSISLYPDGLPTQDDLIVGTGVMNLIYSPLAVGQRQVLITGQCRSNSTTSVTLYLVAAVGSANANVKGYVSARRVR